MNDSSFDILTLHTIEMKVEEEKAVDNSENWKSLASD